MEKSELLCRYRRLNEKNLNALAQGKVYFSTPAFFNDPFDSFAYVNEEKLFASIAHEWETGFEQGEFFKKVMNIDPDCETARQIKERVLNKEAQKHQIQRIKEELKRIQKQVAENTRVICFSETAFSNLMWSHYAEDHTGFALLFDFEDLQSATAYDASDNPIPYKTKLERVNYLKQAPDYGQLFFQEMPNRMTISPPFMQDKKSSTFHSQFLYNKQADWSYEKEWRLCTIGEDLSEKSNAHYLKINPCAVLLGARMKYKDRFPILQILAGKDIKVYEMFADDSTPEYTLRKRRLFSTFNRDLI